MVILFVKYIIKEMPMRKNLITGLALASCFVTAISFNSYAKGWEQSGSDWIYIDNNNSRVRNEWKQGADSKYYWLNSEGVMLKNSFVDDGNYYVGSDGAAIVNSWKQIEAEGRKFWAYFDNKGKVVRNSWKKISDIWYYFDDEGHMATGWVDNNNYYLGENGAMYTGWHKLMPPDQNSDSNRPASPGDQGLDNDKKWYYFGSNGKKYVPSSSFGEKKIGENKYAFDSSGAMVVGWVNVVDTTNDIITDYRYYNSDGTIRKGWYAIQPPDALSSQYDDEVEWFYFNNQGVPQASGSNELKANDMIKISNKYYLFAKNGNPTTGLRKVYTDNSGNYSAYYFGGSDESFAHTGKVNVKQSDGTTETYYFQEGSGKGFTGVRDSSLYYKGRIQRADNDTRYVVISLRDEASGAYTNYVVNTSGKIVRSLTVKNADKVEYKTDASGVLTHVNGSTDGVRNTFTNPTEPVFD